MPNTLKKKKRKNRDQQLEIAEKIMKEEEELLKSFVEGIKSILDIGGTIKLPKYKPKENFYCKKNKKEEKD